MATMDKRIAVVTGGNKGIGFEICRQLAGEGVRVLLTSRDAARGDSAAGNLRAQKLDVLFHPLDVDSDDSVSAFREYLKKEHGRVDVLINNAGILADKHSTSILKAPLDVFRATLETNFFGALRMCQALVPIMRRGHYGRIVNLSSGLGQLSDMGDGTPAYRVSKTALNALTRMVATARTFWSTPSARAGCAPTWADRRRRAAWTRARKPRSGWRCCLMAGPQAASFATGNRFPGNRGARAGLPAKACGETERIHAQA
jgi:NAD(P)-dependent dehydrogenase (short-subunit alcohol dehydrogenase family)